MMKIYFLRHGEAGDGSQWQGEDSKRPLTDDGIERMRRQAKTLASWEPNIELILSSPLTRARQTANIVAKALKLDVTEEDGLKSGAFNLPTLGQILGQHTSVERLMVVGHEPDFSRTISALIGGGSVEMKKGGLAQVEI